MSWSDLRAPTSSSLLPPQCTGQGHRCPCPVHWSHSRRFNVGKTSEQHPTRSLVHPHMNTLRPCLGTATANGTSSSAWRRPTYRRTERCPGSHRIAVGTRGDRLRIGWSRPCVPVLERSPTSVP